MFSIARYIVYSILCISLHAELHADEQTLQQGWVCWPLHFAGITLGNTTDSQVQRLLGSGLRRENEGDTGGRYYIDPKSRASLHIVCVTDTIVGKLTISEGIDPNIKSSERKQAISDWFDPEEGFGNRHALRLNSTKEKVLNNLGRPAKQNSPDEWIYFTKSYCEIPGFFTLVFSGERLTKMVLSAPPG
jgi:hypothetical protein